MVELALLGHRGFEAHPHELTLGRPAYTVETLEFFGDRQPQAELFLLIGQDSFEALPTWRRGVEIPQLAQVGVLLRHRREEQSLEDQAARTPSALESAAAAGRIHFIDNSPCPWSSTALRSQLSSHREDVRLAFDPLVLDYIDKYELYE
jgi:nicotinate-nucleotide adenylyltransferase